MEFHPDEWVTNVHPYISPKVHPRREIKEQSYDKNDIGSNLL